MKLERAFIPILQMEKTCNIKGSFDPSRFPEYGMGAGLDPTRSLPVPNIYDFLKVTQKSVAEIDLEPKSFKFQASPKVLFPGFSLVSHYRFFKQHSQIPKTLTLTMVALFLAAIQIRALEGCKEIERKN